MYGTAVSIFLLGSYPTLRKLCQKARVNAVDNVVNNVFAYRVDNAKKPLILTILFRAFVKSNRATNGRQHGKLRFWLYSHILRLYSVDEQDKDSLFGQFSRVLQSLQQKSMCYIDVLEIQITVMLDLIDISLSVAKRTLGNWYTKDFDNTGVCPHKTDYCPLCFELKTSLKSIAQKIQLLQVNNNTFCQHKCCISTI